MQKAWHHQIDEFLHKPTKIESLRQILQELIEIKESEEDVVLPDPNSLNNLLQMQSDNMLANSMQKISFNHRSNRINQSYVSSKGNNLEAILGV